MHCHRVFIRLLGLLLLLSSVGSMAEILPQYLGEQGIRQQIFSKFCLACHNSALSGFSERNGAPSNVNFDTFAAAQASAARAVIRSTSGTMPPFGDTLNTEEIAAMLAWEAAGFPEENSVVPVPENQTPLVSAGVNMTVNEGEQVVLQGSASDAEDGNNLTLKWQQSSGTPANLGNTSLIALQFTAPVVAVDNEALRFTLTATDSGGLSSNSTVTVNIRKPVSVTPIPVLGATVGGNSIFSGGVTADEGNSYPHDFLQTDIIDVFVNIQSDPVHIGQSAGIFVLVEIEGVLYQRVGAAYIVWDGEIDTLVSGLSLLPLQNFEEIRILEDFSLNGFLRNIPIQILTGYYLPGSDSFVFHSELVHFVVQ